MKPEFNKLSKQDLVKLKGATFTRVMSADMREKTEEKPWRYPLYAAYIVTVATPLPVLGASVVLVAGTALWINMGVTNGSRALKKKLTDSFNEESLMIEHRKHMVEDKKNPESYKVDNKKLAVETAKTVWQDTKDSGRIFRNHLFKK